jgi:predicted transcriptional regulator
MKTTLTDEQRHALDEQPEGIEIEDERTRRVYILADADLHRRAIEALRRQEDNQAVHSGIDDMQAGRVVPFEDVDRRIREKLGLPLRAP